MADWNKPRANGTHTLTTNDLARLLGVTPQTIRTERNRRGHYRGLQPKLTSRGWLLWPRDSVKRLQAQSSTSYAFRKPYIRNF